MLDETSDLRNAGVQVVIPESVKRKIFVFENYFVLPKEKNGKERYMPAIDIHGEYQGKRCHIRLGLFAAEEESKAACKNYFAECAAVAMPIVLNPGSPSVLVGDESWALDSSVVFRAG